MPEQREREREMKTRQRHSQDSQYNGVIAKMGLMVRHWVLIKIVLMISIVVLVKRPSESREVTDCRTHRKAGSTVGFLRRCCGPNQAQIGCHVLLNVTQTTIERKRNKFESHCLHHKSRNTKILQFYTLFSRTGKHA